MGDKIDNFKGKQNSNGFDKRPEDINKEGRPLKIYTILKNKGFKGDDIKSSFKEMAFYTVQELKEVHTDEKKPIIMRIVANQFYKALMDSDWNKIREILEHTIGKPLQQIEHNEFKPIQGITFEEAPEQE